MTDSKNTEQSTHGEPCAGCGLPSGKDAVTVISEAKKPMKFVKYCQTCFWARVKEKVKRWKQ